jgi:hypothetical protein
VTRTWTTEELHEIGAAAELSVAPLRPDGSVRPYTTIWVVRVGDHLYVRSYRGPSGSWYQAVISTGAGRIRAGGIERGVTFDQAPAVEPSEIDDAHRTKYGRSPYVDAIVTPDAASTALRLTPFDPDF